MTASQHDHDDQEPATPLEGVRVVDLSSGLAGAYCTKMLVDVGASVVLVEPEGGHPLRRRTASGASLAPDEDGTLFTFLSGGKSSVVDRGQGHELDGLLAAADVAVVDQHTTTTASAEALHERHPHLVVVSITPFGLTGPWVDRPASDLTLQALSSSLSGRGSAQMPPIAAGGELSAWTAGATAAVAASIALRGVRGGTGGELIDVAELDAAVTIYNGFRAVAGQMATKPRPVTRVTECPSIERAKDGWVGLTTLTAAQFRAFAEMIGRPEWADDPEISRMENRNQRAHELRPQIRAWTEQHTVEEILAEASARRIPCSVVSDGATAPHVDHFVERGLFEPGPVTGALQPRRPYRFGRSPLAPLRPQPRRGASTVEEVLAAWADGPARGRGALGHLRDLVAGRPLAGIRVFDLTSFWAGSSASQVLGLFGADVIKVESVTRPDGTRMATSYDVPEDRRWERSPLFLSNNTNKRGVTLDLASDQGREAGRRLLAACDVLIENYTPRVLDRFDLLDPERDDLIVVRMPAWGLTGPWRDRPGFAQTMEQATGLAWITGFPGDDPILPRGPCDPIGGLHAAFATLAAIAERDRTGRGQLVEVPLVEPALTVAAEQFLEHSTYGVLLERIGNKSRWDAPCDVYRCRGDDQWVAISVTGDEQWVGLVRALGSPDWALDGRFACARGRLDAADELDERLAAWCADRTPAEVADALLAEGVAAAELVLPEAVPRVPQLVVRGFFETVHHPVAGTVALPSFPARFASRPDGVHEVPPPLLGQHNREVLGGLAGLSAHELDELDAAGIIGTTPRT